MRSGTEVVVVEAVRSAVGKRGGSLALTQPIDILGPVQMKHSIVPASTRRSSDRWWVDAPAREARCRATSAVTHGWPTAAPKPSPPQQLRAPAARPSRRSTWPPPWWPLVLRTSSWPVASTT